MGLPIRTTVIGSYPVPSWLAALPSAPALRDALLVVVKTQELCGIDVLADGELSRFDADHPETNGMVDAFVRPLGGVRTDCSQAEIDTFRRDRGMRFRKRPAGVVEGPLTAGSLRLREDWERVRELTDRPLKLTVTSPYMIARTLIDAHYGDLPALADAIAAILAAQVATIDAPVLQVDEANLTGHPADGAWACEPINRVLDAARGEKGLHLCFGNYGGQRVQEGGWADLLPFLAALHADHVLLELARGDADLGWVADLPAGIRVGAGVIDVKDHEVEPVDRVARRIEAVARAAGEDRVGWVHPDCGLWMLPRSIADRKMAALVAGRDRFLGRPGGSPSGWGT